MNKVLLPAIVIVASLSVWSCAKDKPNAAEPKAATRAAQEDDIREAVFRHQFDGWAPQVQKDGGYFYLKINENDPTADFLRRFEGNQPPVKPISASTNSPQGVSDRETGKWGVVFEQDKITWKDDGKVQVSGGYWQAGTSSSGNTYTVEKKDGKWTVTKNDRLWIS